MRAGKSVVDIDVAEHGQRLDERGVVLLLAFVEAQILQQGDVAVLHLGHERFRGRPDAIVREGDGPADGFGERGDERGQRLAGVAPFGPAEMRQDDHFGALGGKGPPPSEQNARSGWRR